MDISVIRSNRKTITLEAKPEGLIVRAPLTATDADIEKVLARHRRWIEAHMEKAREVSKVDSMTIEELRELAQKALAVIPERVRYYAPLVGVTYGRITIRNQRTKWGSCTAQGNLNFNCLLMLTPPEVLDSVVVHELCHRKEMNHSPRFYEEVLRVFPEYHKWDRWLTEHGAELMARMPK